HLRLKYAMTLDGKIAARDGSSQWISCERSRDYVQTLRMQSDAILIGSGTALRDQPRLNVRNVALPQPKRVIADSRLRLTPEMPLFSHTGGEFIVFHALEKPEGKAAALEKIGVKVIACPGDDGKVDLYQALKALARDHGVRNVLCEGGATLNAALVHKKLADSAAVFIAPKILGGSGIAPMESATAYPSPTPPGSWERKSKRSMTTSTCTATSSIPPDRPVARRRGVGEKPTKKAGRRGLLFR
ncbi:MAG: RibD family protein, partial [Planctomycetes bacterium]|nr:RibD family protein [Planctomycetota bacterium]